MFSGRALLPVITPLYTSYWWRERQWGRGRPGFTQSTTENSAQNVRHAFLSASRHTHRQHSIKAAANVTAVYACLMWDSNDLGWWELQLQNEFSYVWSQKDNTPTHTHTHSQSGHVIADLMEWSIRESESNRSEQRGSLSIELEQTLAPGLSRAWDSVSSLCVSICWTVQRALRCAAL